MSVPQQHGQAEQARAGFTAQARAGEILHLWQKPVDPVRRSRVALHHATGEVTSLAGPATDDFQLTIARAPADGALRIDWDARDTEVSLCYAYDPELVFDDGVRLLWTTARSAGDPLRYRLHLAPPFGWMNDPNGMIALGGRTHAFYQHYPHARQWNTMHWGHAVSGNLVDWIHLPVFLSPRPEMLAERSRAGGVFSGSAIPAEEGVRVFHTDREDGRKPEQEWQLTALSPDLLTAGPAEVLIDARPPVPGFGRDLRDPFVLRGPDGRWKMLLGGNDAGAALVLLYETEAADGGSGWRFVGPLHREPLSRSFPAECPCLVPLGESGLWVLVFGLIGHQRPVLGRLNPTLALIGRFDGQHFEEIARQELDFVGDCYAFQGFLRDGQPMGIAWAANWVDVRPSEDFSSAMTFPRRLIWQDGRLLTPPVESVAELRGSRIGAIEDLRAGIALGDGLAEISVSLPAGLPFRLVLDHPEFPMAIVHDGQTLELVADWATHRGRRLYYVAETGPLTDLRLISDVGMIEIFADGGRWCGTKRIASDAPLTSVRLETGADAAVGANIWHLRPQRGAISS